MFPLTEWIEWIDKAMVFQIQFQLGRSNWQLDLQMKDLKRDWQWRLVRNIIDYHWGFSQASCCKNDLYVWEFKLYFCQWDSKLYLLSSQIESKVQQLFLMPFPFLIICNYFKNINYINNAKKVETWFYKTLHKHKI